MDYTSKTRSQIKVTLRVTGTPSVPELLFYFHSHLKEISCRGGVLGLGMPLFPRSLQSRQHLPDLGLLRREKVSMRSG